MISSTQNCCNHQSNDSHRTSQDAPRRSQKQEFNQCRYTALLQHKGNGSVHWARLNCGRWCCRHCRKALQRNWAEHAEKCFRSLRGERCSHGTCVKPAVVYRLTLDAFSDQEWDAVRQKIKRRKFQYLRIRLGYRYVLYVSGPLDGFASETLSVDDAVIRVRRDVDAVQETKRPISTSDGWKQPKLKESTYTALDDRHVQPEVLVKAAEKAGVKVSPWSAGSGMSRVEQAFSLEKAGWGADQWRAWYAEECVAAKPTTLKDLAALRTNYPVQRKYIGVKRTEGNPFTPVQPKPKRDPSHRIQYLKNILVWNPDDLDAERELDELLRSTGWVPLCA